MCRKKAGDLVSPNRAPPKVRYRAVAFLISWAFQTQSAMAENPVGDWGGLLAGRLHIVFHVGREADGKYIGSTESPDQSDAVIPANSVEADSDHLQMEFASLHARYTGRWSTTDNAWIGSLTQAEPQPLILRRLSPDQLKLLKPPRPQDEAAAAAMRRFRPTDVRINNPSAPGVTLAGTLSLPSGAGPFPGVVLIAGSGRQTRDEEIAGHKMFLVLAAALNGGGIAVLRYDKRGTGLSTGNMETATMADFSSDALAVFQAMQKLKGVDPHKIGLIGHSEGAAIAPVVANMDPAVAFVVLIAGPGQRGAEMLLEQQAAIAAIRGTPPAKAAADAAHDQKVIDDVLSAQSPKEAAEKLEATQSNGATDAQNRQDRAFATPWMFNFLRYDPTSALTHLMAPVLVLSGSRDLQVLPGDNLPLIKKDLNSDNDVTIQEIPGLNHLLQDTDNGDPARYRAITETVSPLALDAIVAWVKSHAGHY